jgi:hypothetical protein
MYVLPHAFAHKAEFTDDYKNIHGNDERNEFEALHLARKLVEEVHQRYTQCIQPIKNLIARIQKADKLTEEEKKLIGTEQTNDHPLMKDLIRTWEESTKKAFYE